jgi:L,D-transpeptidase ErfK/SrfK
MTMDQVTKEQAMVRKTVQPLALLMVLLLLLALSLPRIIHADTFVLPADGGTVVGQLRMVRSRHIDTFSDIALAENQGFRELNLANPGVDAWLPGDGTEVLVPSQHVLPQSSRSGVVVNVPEMRLYYFPKQGKDSPPVVMTHPISIGRQEWLTPHGVTRVVAKSKDPAWYPPESIREEHAERGDPLPRIVPPGPDNPLGNYALRLGIPGYLIHGTNKPFGLGMRVTHGCIRMYPADIERIFYEVKVGTPVRIVNQPFKVGLLDDELYVEVHPPLEEDEEEFRARYTVVVDLIVATLSGRTAQIDWNALQEALRESRGVPLLIGKLNADPEQLAQY